MEYVTDTGLVVPSVTTQVRRRLLGLAEEAGLTFSRQAELVGRAATETALHLLGGKKCSKSNVYQIRRRMRN